MLFHPVQILTASRRLVRAPFLDISINAQNARGTIGSIGTICAQNNINLQSVIQKGIKEDNTAQIIVITETSLEADIQNALSEFKNQNIKVTNLIRVI